MITEINESKTWTKHKLCEYKCKLGGGKCSSNQKWNNDHYWCQCRNPQKHHVCKKYYIWNPTTCSSEIG